MRKKVLICLCTVIFVCVLGHAYFSYTLSANSAFMPDYTVGDTIYYANQTYTYVGSDGTDLYLLNNASIATNQTWTNANTNAINHKNNLGNIGKTIVTSELPTTTTLQQAATLSGGKITELNTRIPKITTAWFLGDTDLQLSNLVRFLSANNKSEGTQSISTYKAIGSNSACQSPSTSTTAAGTGFYNSSTNGGETVTWVKRATYTFTSELSSVPVNIRVYRTADCSDSDSGTMGTHTNTTNSYAVTVTQPDYNGKITVDANPRIVMTQYSDGKFIIPSGIGNTNSKNIVKGTCYVAGYSNVGDYSSITSNNTNLNSNVYGIKFSADITLTSKLTNVGAKEMGSLTCPNVTNNAYTASVRPLVKVPIAKILYANQSKPSITPKNKIEGSEPTSDSDGINAYLTMDTTQMRVGLQSGVNGVSGNTYNIERPKDSTVINLPLSISGTQEGTRYIAAKAVDTSGNEKYSVLSVASSSSPSVALDYDNLLNTGNNTFQVTLYVVDSGTGNTMYRSEGTTITVQFEKSDYSLTFTDPDVTNMKIGSADVKETITTDNPEISTEEPNAVVYTLNGGISGTGLSVNNDSSDPKGFIISIGNMSNPGLPSDFTLTAELETATSNKATASKQIHVFQEMSEFKWIPKRTGSYSTTEAGNNVLLGNLEVQNGLAKYIYALTSPSDSGYDVTKAKDNSCFTVTNTALNSGEKAEVKTSTALMPGSYNIQCKVTDSYGDVLYTDFTITVSANEQTFMYTDISGNELPKSGTNYAAIQEIYALNKTFRLYTAGNPTGSIVTYQLKSGSPTDVISVDNNGLVTILNASLNNQFGKVIVQATSHDPSGNYSDSTIELPINIGKGTLTISFDNPNETKKSISDTNTSWNETATANPITDTKITYELSGGKSTLINIDKDSGQITYSGNGDYGKLEIRATVDDDPISGNDNYEKADTTKEIFIYREVDGNVIPDSNSSSNTVPTFTASDTNVKQNGIIGTIQGTLGTPDNITEGDTTYTYGIKIGTGDANLFSVDANSGIIKAAVDLGVKSYSIIVTVSDKYSTKEIPITISVGVAGAEDLRFYETSAAINMITQKSVKVTDTNVTVYATVKGSTNNNQVKYRIEDGSTNIIEVNEISGAVTIHGVGTVTIIAEKKGASGQADAQAELIFTVTAGAQNFIYTDNAGNELPKSGSNYAAKTDTYAPNKTFQLYTAGNPTGSTVTYQLKAGSPTDVISVDGNGLVTILNASLNNQMGKVIVQATSHDPTGNYSDKTIELPINIEKGTRTIAFAEDPIYVVNGKGQVTPVTEVDGVTDTDGDILIEVDSNEDGSTAWTSDNKTIEYDYTEANPKDIKIHATKPMDRNYKAAEADGTIHIMGPDENVLAITSPGKITYGDRFTIRSSQYDADSTNVQYTFEIDNTTYISNPTVNGNNAQFDAIKYSGTNKTTITVTRTAEGETPLSKKVQVTVLPKPIEIIIDDKEKLKGEQNPILTYQDFKNKLVSWNGVQDIIQENDIKLSTTAKTDSNAGSYPIKGDANTLNKTYPNYTFSFKEGTLTIKEENIEDDWYYLEIDDGNNTAYTGNWTNQNVSIISDHPEYINLSLDQSTWNPTKVTVSKEGEINQSFWMKKDSGAITKEKQELIKIDKTPPKVKGIKAKDTNNKLQDIINKLSGGIFFKPGTAFEISTDDSKDDLKVSGTKEIAYKVYKVEQQARSTDELIKEGNLTVTNEKAIITISETTGKYKVCVTPTDNAGNTNTESCHEVELKKINVDVDNDGKLDFNDPNGDGCPDLNIKWKDPNDETKWIVLNGDRDNDSIPDLNIDSDGDGKPDLNIDTDRDGKPDLNLVILKKSDWKPSKCVKADLDNEILEEYCTGTSAKAVINVDTDGDNIPNINIDNKGDFKPHINISKDGVNPIINITVIHDWKPNNNYTSNKFTYDSIGKDDVKAEINIDSDNDGYPDINLDLDGDGVPDLNVDIDGDYIPDMNIDSNGDGKADINVDIDNDGKPDKNLKEITEWKPEHNVDGEFPYDTMEINEPEEPNEPEGPKEPNDPKEPKTEKPGDNKENPKTSVMGYYNPVTSMGGAKTGDQTHLLLYIGLLCSIMLGIVSYMAYKSKKNA